MQTYFYEFDQFPNLMKPRCIFVFVEPNLMLELDAV